MPTNSFLRPKKKHAIEIEKKIFDRENPSQEYKQKSIQKNFWDSLKFFRNYENSLIMFKKQN